MIMRIISKWCRCGSKPADKSLLIKDYDAETGGNGGGSVVPLRGGAATGVLDQPFIRKKEPVEVIAESVDRLVQKLDGINDGLSRQTQQNERLTQKLDQLPMLLAPMPDAIAQQRQALFQMLEQLRRKVEQDEALAMLLAKLPQMAEKQSESLEAIGDHLASGVQVDEKLAGTFERVVESVGKLDAETAAQTEWLQRMSQTFADNERLIKETLAAQHRRFLHVLGISIGICLLVIIALIVTLALL